MVPEPPEIVTVTAEQLLSVTLGASKGTDVTEGANAPSAGFVELRVDEAISTDHDKILQAIKRLVIYLQEDQRYL